MPKQKMIAFINKDSLTSKDHDKIVKFIECLEEYQSNHYGSFDGNILIDCYNNLPQDVKKAIQPNKVGNLYRGTDGLNHKPAISFTDNKAYADSFGTFTIPFTSLLKYDAFVDTKKLVSFLNKNKIKHEVGDDEGEVIVLNPIFKNEFIENIESYRN